MKVKTKYLIILLLTLASIPASVQTIPENEAYKTDLKVRFLGTGAADWK